MIERYVEDRDGIIFVKGSGQWSREDVDDHYRALGLIIDAYRAADRPIRVLSDITEAERQAPDIEAHIREQMTRLYRPSDRVALLVAGTDDQNHVRAILGSADVAAFVSHLAAEIWLMSEGLTPPGRS